MLNTLKDVFGGDNISQVEEGACGSDDAVHNALTWIYYP